MGARSGMADLIQRLRQLTEAGTDDYTLAGVTYWSDSDIEDALDETRKRHDMVQLIAKPKTLVSDDQYYRYELPYGFKAIEGTAGGSEIFRICDSTGADISSASYSFSERDLAITFTADQEGSARYWSGYAYDLRESAMNVWLRKAAHAHTAINFSADGHQFSRAVIYDHCMLMAKSFGYQAGARVSVLQRTDLAGVGDGDRF